MPYPDIGGGRSINPGLMNANKEARKLFYVGAGSPARGTILRISGTDGQTLTALPATNATLAGSSGPLYMLVSQKIADGSTPGFLAGFCKGVMHGVIEEQNTSALAVGDPIYLSTAGGWTATKPTAAGVRLIGYVIKVGTTDGQILFIGTPMSETTRPHMSPMVVVSKAATAGTAVFSVADLGGNYDGKPVVASVMDGTKYVTGVAWNGSGQLTITSSASHTSRIAVCIGIDGDSL